MGRMKTRQKLTIVVVVGELLLCGAAQAQRPSALEPRPAVLGSNQCIVIKANGHRMPIGANEGLLRKFYDYSRCDPETNVCAINRQGSGIDPGKASRPA